MHTIANAIGGALAQSSSPRSQPVFNPATGEQSAILKLSTAAELDAAVAAAKLALPAWADMPPMRRAKYMFRFKQLLDANTDKIAEAISAEHGKTHADAVGEVQRGIEVVDFCCGIRNCSRANSPATSGRRSTRIATASRSVSAPASRRSIFRQWCRCGCIRWGLPAGTRSY